MLYSACIKRALLIENMLNEELLQEKLTFYQIKLLGPNWTLSDDFPA
jgi:hypothetical protein